MQAHTGRQMYGETIIQHLAELGFLSPRVNLNHAIWLTEQDIHLLAQSGAGTTHNLLSNFKLGSANSTIQVDGGNYAIGGTIANGAGAGTLISLPK